MSVTDDLTTVGFHIDAVRERFNETSDDSTLEDLLIYATMVDVRAQLIDQEITKRKEIDTDFYQTICISLCEDQFAKCCGTSFNINKTILRSTTNLPDYITHKYIQPMLVTTIDGEQVIDFQKTATTKWDKYWDIDPIITYDITNFSNNRTLIVNGTLALNGLLVTAAFVDPAGAILSQDCSENGDCPDWKDVTFPLPSKLRRPFWQMVVQDLASTLGLPTDVSNNAQSTKQEI